MQKRHLPNCFFEVYTYIKKNKVRIDGHSLDIYKNDIYNINNRDFFH